MKAVMEGKSFNEEQTKWLGFIREHLIQNLTIEEKDFNEAPVFGLRGGLDAGTEGLWKRTRNAYSESQLRHSSINRIIASEASHLVIMTMNVTWTTHV